MYLMHKNDIVAKIGIYKNTPVSVSEIYKPELMPVGTKGDLSFADRNIATWSSYRVIPQGRANIKNIESQLGSVADLSMQSMGLSLTDCYWYVDEEKVNDYKWADINFHDNGFISDMLLLKQKMLDKTHRCPDYTTDGFLEKMWFCNNGVAYLIKDGTFDGALDEPVLAANEVVASLIANRMGIDCVQYQKTMLGSETFCICPCFSNPNEDIVTAQVIANQLDTYDNFVVRKYIRDLGFGEDIDKMAALHVLIHNHDGHLSNFALVMDANTGEYIRFEKLYDNGNSLNWHKCDVGLDNMRPFESSQEAYAESIETYIVLPKLSELEEIVREVYADFGISEWQLQVALTELEHGYGIIENRMQELEQELNNEDIGIGE